MLVLVNGRPLAGVLTGIARYTRLLYQTMVDEGLADVRFWCRGQASASMPEQSTFVPWLRLPTGVLKGLRVGGTAWNDHRLGRALKGDSFDLYHETGMFPGKHPRRVPTILTIYDLSLHRYPETHPHDRVWQFERYFFQRLTAVDHVLTISEFMRGELVERLGLDAKSVTAVPLAAAPSFFMRPAERVRQFLVSRGLPDEYMLYVGTLEPRKNLVQVIRAMARMTRPLPLVCAGWQGWSNNEFDATVRRLGLTEKVIRLGHCPDEDLARLYSGATIFVYPSLYEGFGLPVLEAMACGCPVICSDQASLPEVAGQAAVFVSPFDEQALAEKLDELAGDSVMRQEWVNRGVRRAAMFSWSQTARGTIDAFIKVCGQ